MNLELLRLRAGEIRFLVSQLRAAATRSAVDFAADADPRDAALYRLLVAIESAQAICNHIAANLPTRVPESLPDCFRALAERGVVEPPLAERLAAMARFRNLLVHRYWELDYQRVHGILLNDLTDLEQYLEAVGRHIGVSL